MCELERRFYKCRDVCINNREELLSELKKQFGDHSLKKIDFEGLEYFNSLSPGD